MNPLKSATGPLSAVQRADRSARSPECFTAGVGAPVAAPWAGSARILAVGADLKNAFCLLEEGKASLGETLGDLARPDAFRALAAAVASLTGPANAPAHAIACDLHPRYLSTALAQERCAALANGDLPPRLIRVQHHHAHIASVMAERGVDRVIGVACDGTGFGIDGAAWGCEILRCERAECDRLGHLDYFPLPGGDAAAIDTWRPAAALLRMALGPRWELELRVLSETISKRFTELPEVELRVCQLQLDRNLNTPPSSSLGRLFDAAAFLLGLCQTNHHEAQAACSLETAASEARDYDVEALPFRVFELDGQLRLSLAPAFASLVELCGNNGGEPTALLAARFHETVALMLATAAQAACERTDIRTVALSGGCFANRILLGTLTNLLERRGFCVLSNAAVSPGDAGIALGQAYVAAWQLRKFSP